MFGSEGETQLIFSPSIEVKGAARWTVCLLPVPISGYDTQTRTKPGRPRALGQRKGRAIVAYQAAEQLLACHVEMNSPSCYSMSR